MEDAGRVPPQRAAAPSPRRGAPPLRHIGLVAAGGAVGALARVALATAFPVRDGAAYPWTTFVENLVGAFLLGVVLTALAERGVPDHRVRLALCTGALGAFTTYSTVAVELGGRLLDGHHLLAATYATASLVCGLAVAFLGVRVARSWLRTPARPADDGHREGRA